MNAIESLPRRLGLDGEPCDRRFSWRLIAAVLLIYTVSFAAFYPRVVTNDDESEYLRQTRLLLEGRSSIVQTDPFTGEEVEVTPATWPLGIALLSAPFVAAAGWRGAYVVPCIGLLLTVLLTGAWLREAGRPPAFALLLLGFPATLVMGRVAMSDMPSTAWVAFGLWLFWRGAERPPGWWLAAGFVAGASLMLRVTNPLIFVPLFAGTVLRREWKAWALVVGGLVGIAMRPLSMQIYFGSALFERSMYHFSPDTIPERIPLYLMGLLVLVPGGLLLSLLYRGKRRPEIVLTLVLFVLFFLGQEFSTIETGMSKRLVLGLRYFLPLLPVMAFAMGESTPRLWQRWIAAGAPWLRRLASWGLALWLLGVGVAAAAVHPAFSAWTSTQAELRDEIDRIVPDDALLITNWYGTKKFVRLMDRRFAVVKIGETAPPGDMPKLLERHPEAFLVILDRSDSEFWRNRQALHQAVLDEFSALPHELLSEIRPTSTDHLRIWRVRGTARP